jgi:PilZ domain
MDSFQRPERRSVRYPLNLPVSLILANKQLHVRSESISLGGILLSSAFPISEGSKVEVAIGVAHLPQPGTQLTARGTVLRVQPRAAGDFAVSIAFERPFQFVPQSLSSGSSYQGKEPRLARRKNTVVGNRSLCLGLAWHTET